ncbi:MAG: hypothetical protein ACR2OJ_15795 [Hyphomicrobiales bacterium]
MPGNKNSGRRQEKPFADALRIEIAALTDDRKGLRRVARKLIEKAESGDLAAIKELADRTDGRSVQQNINQHELDAQQDMIIEVTIGGEHDCVNSNSTPVLPK